MPSLTGYQALIQERPCFTTNIAPLPIIPRPVSEWGTIYTALRIAQGISVETFSPAHKTTISLDLALYEKALQLTGSRRDMRDQFNLRLGELHVIKAHLLCLGSFVLGSGYELVWNEAGVYGPTTTRAILNASHIRWGMQAHEDNLIALMQLLVEELYKENPLLEDDVRVAARGFSTDEDAEHQDVH